MIQIKEHPNYFINENGIITNIEGKYVRICESHGRLYCRIDNQNIFIDELVAKTFLDNKNNYEYISHKDGDVFYNHFSNLEWVPDKKLVMDNSESLKDYSLNDHYSSCTVKVSPYRVFNPCTDDEIICNNRAEVAELIQYELISLKNMVGNGRKIALGPFKGYQIERIINK